MSKAIVIGAGIAGLASAIRLREEGLDVTLATFGTGGLPLSTGCIDVLGYVNGERVVNPLDQLDDLGGDHPYAVIGKDAVRDGVEAFVRWCSPSRLVAPTWTNHLVPTAMGTLRPTCVVQPSMDSTLEERRILVVGIRQFKDFHAALVAGNLARVLTGVRYVEVDYPARGEADPSGTAIAMSLDDPSERTTLAERIRPHVGDADVLVMPAIIGRADPAAPQHLCELLGVEIVEVPCLPPSVPGERLNDHLVSVAKEMRIRWILGSRITGGTFEGNQITSVTLAATGADKTLTADHVVLATGGFESGALAMDSFGNITETVFDLPLWTPDGDLIHGNYLGGEQPLFRSGVRTDENMRPVDASRGVIADNLYTVGGLLAGAMRWDEHSGEGIALGSAWKATSHIVSTTAGKEGTR